MGQYLKLYLVTFGVFFLVDIVWLGLVAKNMYREHLGMLMKANVNWPAAIIFYLLFIAGLIFFVIDPALAKDSLQYALLAGGFFGLITYATYDLTNLATLNNWPIFITVVDLIWGTVLSASTASISFLLVQFLKIK